MKKIFSIYILFVFIPITLVIEHFSPHSSNLIFFSAALSIIPIARLISESTENLSHYTGDAVGGLLNATFGNFPEFIIILMALKAGLQQMVLASIIGAILANLLLALGVSFFLGGLKFHIQEFNPVSSRIYSTMMFIAVISLVVPSSFSKIFGSEDLLRETSMLNIGLCIVLLTTYIFYIFFMVKTHPDFFKSVISNEETQEHTHHWSIKKSVTLLILASLMAALMSEILVGSAEETGKSLGMTTVFIGIVILSIVGGAAESLSAISMARKNKLDLTLGICLGSCIQIALFIAPVSVFMSYIFGNQPLNLTFGRAELGALFLAVLMGIMIVSDGKSNWYKGVQLIAVYIIIAVLFYFIPE